MRRNALVILTAAFLVVVGIQFYLPSKAHASFNANDVMDDSVMDNSNAMSASGIDAWLNNNFPSSCISTNNGFAAADPTGYNPTQGFLYGGNVSAGNVIAHAAQAYGINPEVLLVTLQKEQSLVSGSAGCSVLRYAAATGYGCPDGGTTYNYSGANLYSINGVMATSVTGTCVNGINKAGFSQQVIRAAWLLKFGEQRSEGNTGWAVISGNWNNSDDPGTCYGGPMTQGYRKRCSSDANAVYYDGYITIDGSSTHMDTGSTAALYWYTPHFAGNQNFVSLFESWFGPTTGLPFSAAFMGESSTTFTINQTQKPTVWFEFKNTGTQFWKDSASALPYYPVTRLAGTWPINRVSVFNDPSWPAPNRPVSVFNAVYESDGTTLASDQHTVYPGQIAKFQFALNNPTGITPGYYQENFELVQDGAPNWWVPGGYAWQGVTVPAPFAAQFRGESAINTTVTSSTKGTVYFDFQNTGYQFWKDQSSALPYYPITRLADTWPINRVSAFADPSWLYPNRPVAVFTQVFENDGVTPSADQHTVWPGQVARFQFLAKYPDGGIASGTYKENFELVQDGAPAWWVPGGYAWQGIVIP